jgi:hypothetical protein
VELERGNTVLHPVDISRGKRLSACQKTDHAMNNTIIDTFLQWSGNNISDDGYLKESKYAGRTNNKQQPKKKIFYVFSNFILQCW